MIVDFFVTCLFQILLWAKKQPLVLSEGLFNEAVKNTVWLPVNEGTRKTCRELKSLQSKLNRSSALKTYYDYQI